MPPADLSKFVCLRCGACCRIPGGIVRLRDEEIAPIAAALGMTEQDFIDRRTRLAPDRRSLVLLDKPDGSCEMLDESGACRIHAVKPAQCRSFPHAWRNPDSATACPGLRALAEAAPAAAPPAWPALRQRLARSRFRSRFRLSETDRATIARDGWATIEAQARKIVSERLAPAAPRNDGRQTPMRGHPVFVAQHATACCCRSCLAKWHGIPAGRALSPAELDHVVATLLAWMREKAGDLSGLPEQPMLF